MSSTSLTILVGRFMPVVVFALFGYTYYVFLIRLCVQTILVQQNEIAQAIVYLVLVNVLFFLMLLSYLRILFRGPGSPLRPPKSRVTSSTTAPMPGQVPYIESSNIPATTQPTQHTVITIPQSNPSVADQSPTLLDKDTVQPMETAVLRTSPNPLPTISEVGTPHATTDAEMGLATTTTTTASSSALAPPVQIPASSSTAAVPRMPVMFVSKKDGRLRWCDRCNTIKPDRTHHCSECDSCVLKMDHHCPWVNGCVGYYNYKYFYLFILYTSLYADFCFAATVSAIVEQLKRAQDVDIQWIVLLILAFLFGLLLTGFTVVHTSYIFLNRTTIESISHDTRQYFVRVQLGDENSPGHGVSTTNSGENLWDLGWRENFKSVMGKHWWLWCVPFGDPPGDGLSFPFNSQVRTRLIAQAKRQAKLQEDRMVMMMQQAQQGVTRMRQFE